MYIKKYFTLFVVFGLLLFSCSDLQVNRDVLIEKYSVPNIDSLISQQVRMLDGRKVNKKVILDGNEEVSTIGSDSIFWKSELSVFSNLEINKSSLIGAYDKVEKDNTIAFERREGEKKGPLNIKIISSGRDLLQVSGTLNDINPLYSSRQKLLLSFDEKSQSLKSYQFSGYQKLILKDTIFFEVSGRVE